MVGIWTVSPVHRSKRPSWSGHATTHPSRPPIESGAAMCGQRSSVTTIPSAVQATSRSSPARVTRRIEPGVSSPAAAISTNAATRVPGARSSRGTAAMGTLTEADSAARASARSSGVIEYMTASVGLSSRSDIQLRASPSKRKPALSATAWEAKLPGSVHSARRSMSMCSKPHRVTRRRALDATPRRRASGATR